MTARNPQTFQRRHFLRTTGGLVAGAWGAALARADDLPENTNPTAILGDAVEPDWHERLEITVGNKDADLVGATERVIQAGVDYIARRGGGTVRILPGTYRMHNSVFLQSKVRLLGSGTDSVLVKEPLAKTMLTIDGDHWDQEVTLADPNGFHVGDGVRLFASDPFGKGANVMQRTLVASSGNRFKLDTRLQERFYLGGKSEVATHFSLLQCTEIADVIIENLTLDGNKAHNKYEHGGPYDDGCIRFDRSNRITVRGVTVHDFYCDGIVWGITHDVFVENCHLYDGVRFAIHPGSGSQRTILRGNRLHHNDEGIYFCWGASHGLYEKNVIEDCTYGITIGYRDSNNLIRDNDIRRSGVAGIWFRGGSEGNRIERNRIVDSGPEKGIGIDVNGAKSVTLMKNALRETRKPASRTGIRIAVECRDTRCVENQIDGFATAIADLRKA